MYPTQATKLTYGWIKTGKTKHVGTTTSRTRLDIIGAIQLGSIAEAINSQYEAINAEEIIDLWIKLKPNTLPKKPFI